MNVVLATLLASGCSGACGRDEKATAPSPDAAADSTTGGSGGVVGVGGTKADGSDASKPCVPPPPPDTVPAGWEPYTDFSCLQPFYVPPSEDYLPEPIQWETCAAASGLLSGCRQMTIAWPGTASLLSNWMGYTSDGRLLVYFTRIAEMPNDGFAQNIIAEVDGPVRFAIQGPRLATAGFAVVEAHVNEGYFAIDVRGGDGTATNVFDSHRRGVLVGKVGDLRPTLFQLEETPLVYSYRISSKFLARAEAPLRRITIFPLDGSSQFELASADSDPDGLEPDLPILLGDTAVFDTGTLLMAGIMAYDPIQKTHALIRWYGDQNQGAYNVGTDGKDLVWTHGEVHPPPGVSIAYEKRSIYTSPFSTDASNLLPKRLRSDLQTAYDVNFAVGCGYAAHQLQKPDGLLIVRLSDGVSWVLPNDLNSDDDGGWLWSTAIGVTCDEVFATAAVVAAPGAKLVYTIARVKLDTLGPGLPPD
jgi:hypothetical protein